MIRKFIFPLIGVLIMIIHTNGQVVETNNIVKNVSLLNEETSPVAESITTEKIGHDSTSVKIQLYYECLCPDCRNFDTRAFKQTVLDLGPYLDIHLYPYAWQCSHHFGDAGSDLELKKFLEFFTDRRQGTQKAGITSLISNGNFLTETVDNGGGNYYFICQHGPAECYGNKLHACAIDILQNITVAVLYNSCLMDYSQAGKGSDDTAADVCGSSMNINSEVIKDCAKGDRGTELLKFYGDESKKAGFKSVPHILINGAKGRDDHFREDVCKAFKNPPRQCSL